MVRWLLAIVFGLSVVAAGTADAQVFKQRGKGTPTTKKKAAASDSSASSDASSDSSSDTKPTRTAKKTSAKKGSKASARKTKGKKKGAEDEDADFVKITDDDE